LICNYPHAADGLTRGFNDQDTTQLIQKIITGEEALTK